MKGECAIFVDVMTQIVKSVKELASKVKNSSSKIKQGVFAAVAVVSIVASLLFTGTRLAYTVKYDGKVIATVGSKQQFDDAMQLVVNLVDDEGVRSTISEPQFTTTLVRGENINNTQEVADAIINNTEEIVAASTLYVNGRAVVTAEKSLIEEQIANRLNRFNVVGQACDSRFVDQITTQDGYFLAKDIDDITKVKGAVSFFL